MSTETVCTSVVEQNRIVALFCYLVNKRGKRQTRQTAVFATNRVRCFIRNNANALFISKLPVAVFILIKRKKSKVKQSRYTPWRRLAGEKV
jgi:hypothetical protein